MQDKLKQIKENQDLNEIISNIDQQKEGNQEHLLRLLQSHQKYAFQCHMYAMHITAHLSSSQPSSPSCSSPSLMTMMQHSMCPSPSVLFHAHSLPNVSGCPAPA